MAFVTGSANTMADLLAAVQNACTANGWTLSGSVLHKGTCYMEVKISGINLLQVEGGTGIDASNNLTGRSDMNPGAIGNTITYTYPSNGSVLFAFPVTYFIHINTNPDEVYVVANYSVSYYQLLSFGQSAMPGLGASGNWYCGGNSNYATVTSNGVNSYGGYYYSSDGMGGELFCRIYGAHLGVNTNMDGAETWASDAGQNYTGICSSEWYDLWKRQPNAWNGESILIPVRAYASRGSNFYSPVLECAHARHINIQNLNDQDVITIGSDKWKIYPWWHRGTSWARTAGDSNYTGHALRYDGP